MSDVGIMALRTAGVTTAVTVTNAATKIPATPLTDRRSVMIYNNGDATAYVGFSTVTAADGMPLFPTESIIFLVSDAVDLYGICAGSDTTEIRVLEA